MALAEYPLSVVSRRDSALIPAHDAEPTVVRLRGEHDMSTAAALSDILDLAIALDRDVMMDLGGVEFMAASTVGVILRARESLRLRSRSLALRSPSRCARRVLELCGLAALIDPAGAEVAWGTGTADGPSSWAVALAPERLDRRSKTSAASPADASDALRVVHVADRRPRSSAVADERAEAGWTNVAGGGGT